MKRRAVLLGLSVLVLSALPFVVTDPYWLHLLIMLVMYMMLAASVDIIYGYAGQLNLGQGAFAAIGSYITGLLMLRLHVSYWVAMPLSGLGAAFFG